MTTVALAPAAQETELRAFLAGLEPATALRVRTLAHAWTLGGGTLAVGRLSVRLVGGAGPRAFTAGTLHARAATSALELSRVLLLGHGVDEVAWRDWCDEQAELRPHGFESGAKFPAVRLDALPDAVLVRLALGLRDLGRLAAVQQEA